MVFKVLYRRVGV